MKRIGLHDADGTRYPNLALLKLAAAHRTAGHHVEWFMPLQMYDEVYCSGVFSWIPANPYLPKHTQFGGTGFDLIGRLPERIEHTCPDYAFGNLDYSLGFLTRGCPNACSWCIVPSKEGNIHPHADIEEFCRHRDVVLMDNNILACTDGDYGMKQIEKMARMGLRVDFNQGLDARRIDRDVARRLAALKWRHPIRLACDHAGQMAEVERAVTLLRAAGATPKQYFCYVLVKDVEDALERVEFLRRLDVTPFAQPYRDRANTPITEEQRHFARWVNMKMLFKTVRWEDEQRHKKARSRAS